MTIVLMALLGQTVNAQWWTTGNSPAPGAVFGTNNGEPLRFRTNSTQRMHINQSGTFTNGTVPTDGYIGIGEDPTDIRSRLTITGTNNTGFGGDGFRAWMKTGVLNLENSDNMYVGMKEEGFNHSDAVISFGDDNSNNEKNNFRILFANHGLGVNGPHVELARYTSTGNIGFGPQFTNTDQPSSLLHLCKDQNYATFLQIGTRLGTGMQQGDGLRLGVDGSNTAMNFTQTT